MAKNKKYVLLLTCAVLSITATSLTVASLSTQQWVLSKILLNPINTESDKIKFGLFSGLMHQNTATQATFELTMTCLFSENVCALLCGPEDYRYDNLWKIYYGQLPTLIDFSRCAAITVDRDVLFDFYDKHNRKNFSASEEKYFINALVWVCTIVFLVLSVTFGTISSALTAWNATYVVKKRYLNVFGIYIYNAIAAFCSVVATVLWAIIFAASIKHNVPTFQTFVYGFTTESLSQLGFSFYINLAAIFLYITSIFILFLRDYILSNTIDSEKSDEDLQLK